MKNLFLSGARSLLPGAACYGLVVFAGFALVTTTWWFQDDWHFLANALGIAPRGAGLARYVSYELYWRAFAGLFGTGAIGWAVTRLVVHFANALLIRAIATRLTGHESTGFVAGLLFAATPLAFECLYWASGVVDLLGLAFALLAFFLWLRAGRRVTLAVAGSAAAGVFSKETALAFVAFLVFQAARDRRMTSREFVWVAALLVASAVAIASLQRDMTQAGDYGLALAAVPRNLAIFGYWLVVPAPLMKSVALHSATTIGVGAGVWSAWAVFGVVMHRRGNALPALAGIAAVGVLLPSMLVGDHAVPRYVYAASPAFCFALATAFGGLGAITPPRRIVIAFLATLTAWTIAAYQVDARWPSGRPLHRYVVKREISVMAIRAIRRVPAPRAREYTLVVAPRADRDEVGLLKDAIADDLAVKVMFGPTSRVRWVDRIEDGAPDAALFLVEGMTVRPIGPGGS